MDGPFGRLLRRLGLTAPPPPPLSPEERLRIAKRRVGALDCALNAEMAIEVINTLPHGRSDPQFADMRAAAERVARAAQALHADLGRELGETPRQIRRAYDAARKAYAKDFVARAAADQEATLTRLWTTVDACRVAYDHDPPLPE